MIGFISLGRKPSALCLFRKSFRVSAPLSIFLVVWFGATVCWFLAIEQSDFKSRFKNFVIQVGVLWLVLDQISHFGWGGWEL